MSLIIYQSNQHQERTWVPSLLLKQVDSGPFGFPSGHWRGRQAGAHRVGCRASSCHPSIWPPTSSSVHWPKFCCGRQPIITRLNQRDSVYLKVRHSLNLSRAPWMLWWHVLIVGSTEFDGDSANIDLLIYCIFKFNYIEWMYLNLKIHWMYIVKLEDTVS